MEKMANFQILGKFLTKLALYKKKLKNGIFGDNTLEHNSPKNVLLLLYAYSALE